MEWAKLRRSCDRIQKTAQGFCSFVVPLSSSARVNLRPPFIPRPARSRLQVPLNRTPFSPGRSAQRQKWGDFASPTEQSQDVRVGKLRKWLKGPKARSRRAGLRPLARRPEREGWYPARHRPYANPLLDTRRGQGWNQQVTRSSLILPQIVAVFGRVGAPLFRPVRIIGHATEGHWFDTL